MTPEELSPGEVPDLPLDPETLKKMNEHTHTIIVAGVCIGCGKNVGRPE